MSDPLLQSVVDCISNQLVILLSQEFGLPRRVRAELEKLQHTVTTISPLLCEPNNMQGEAAEVKDWLAKLQDVVYDADDLLDDLSTEALRRRRVTGRGKRILNEARIFFSSTNQLFYAMKMAHRVTKIRGQIVSISIPNDGVHYQLDGNSNGSSLIGNGVIRPETYPLELETYVIGRDKDKERLIGFFLDPEFGYSPVLPIVGLGGIGKTTLARLVFNDKRVNDHFELKFWVSVSVNFDVQDILRKILREHTPERDLSSLDFNGLRAVFGEELDRKKYLLVLDDLWNENQREWLCLEQVFMNAKRGSKIVVTTRSLGSARDVFPICCQLCGLTEFESLSLIMRMARKQEHEWRNQNLEIIAREILKRCAGVPFAIMVIGRLLLFSRNTEEEWLNLKNNHLSKVILEESDIMPLLKLSYDCLPSPLKKCFAYCSIFPRDYELETHELIRLWIAQGFINSCSGKSTFEEVGHDYFMELLSRYFFQDIKVDKLYGNIISCKMHGLMHDLAQSVAGDNCITIDSSPPRGVPDRARHMCTIDLEELNVFKMNERMRSLLNFVEKGTEMANLDASRFRNLRVLRLRSAGIKVIFSSISKLKHLKTLDLSFNSELTDLPNSISKLCNLETLDLVACRGLQRLPRGITKLVNLRQLDVSGCDKLTHMPRGVGKLPSLQMLNTFIVGEEGNPRAAELNELSRLTGLRNEKLSIRNLERVGSSILSEVDASFSINKLPLRSLKLHWDHRKAQARVEEVLERLRPHLDLEGLSIDGYAGVISPSSWIFQLHKLVVIEIIECDQCTHLPPLDHLPSLKRIFLYELDNLEWIELSECESGTSRPNFFASLEEIELAYLPKFKGWTRSRRRNKIEPEKDIPDDDDLLMLPTFSYKVKVSIEYCPRFSYLQDRWLSFPYMRGRRLELRGTTSKMLEQLSSNVNNASLHFTTRFAMVSVSSIPLSAVTSLIVSGMENLPVELISSLPSLHTLAIEFCSRLKAFSVKHLPLELFHSLSSLRSLKIKCCPRLKALPATTILRYLTTLESLEIHWCEELDLSIDNDDEDEGGKGINDLELRGHRKLRHITISGIHKMETLPWWIKHITRLESLRLSYCIKLKALPECFPQLPALEHLSVKYCGELSTRCRKHTGEYWPRIFRIPHVIVW